VSDARTTSAATAIWVTLALDVNGFARDPLGGTRAGFSATAEINRRDFGITTNMLMDGGGPGGVRRQLRQDRPSTGPADGDAGGNLRAGR
jgi:hypothetical protein